MPKLGEIRRASEIGKWVESHPTSRKTIKGSRYIWHACIDCGVESWVPFQSNQPIHQQCRRCHLLAIRRFGSDNTLWTGGHSKAGHNGEYIAIKVYEDDFFYPMADKRGYVLEHRLVVAKALGRNLHRWEMVHHKGTKYPMGSIEDKQDNRYPENLQLVSDLGHKQITILENRIKYLEAQNKELRKKLSEVRLMS